MPFTGFSFGPVRSGGVTYDHDTVIVVGQLRGDR